MSNNSRMRNSYSHGHINTAAAAAANNGRRNNNQHLGAPHNGTNLRKNSDYDNNNGAGEELVTINGVTGVIVNKEEIDNWRGPFPLSEYPINVDPNPIVIRKKCDAPVITNHQNVYIRYLRPPTPPPAGDIIIQQEAPQYIEPPPIILRECVPKKSTRCCPQQEEDFIVIREAPPKEYLTKEYMTKSSHELNMMRESTGATSGGCGGGPIYGMTNSQSTTSGFSRRHVGEAVPGGGVGGSLNFGGGGANNHGGSKKERKTIKILGYNFTLGPRKLIIERRAPTPEKPQSIIVERWLAPTSKQRRAVFRATPGQAMMPTSSSFITSSAKNSTIRNEKFDQDVVYDEIRL